MSPWQQVLYVMQLYQNPSLGDASVTSVTEYLLTQPILSFMVSSHAPLDEGDSGEYDEFDAGPLDPQGPTGKPFDSRRNVVLIKLQCIQTWYVCVCIVEVVV